MTRWQRNAPLSRNREECHEITRLSPPSLFCCATRLCASHCSRVSKHLAHVPDKNFTRLEGNERSIVNEGIVSTDFRADIIVEQASFIVENLRSLSTDHTEWHTVSDLYSFTNFVELFVGLFRDYCDVWWIGKSILHLCSFQRLLYRNWNSIRSKVRHNLKFFTYS